MQTRILIQTFVRAGVALLLLFGMTLGAGAQVNSGSNGSDGAFNPTTNIVINMADHPDGIYQFTSVNIPSGVTVSFIPNAAHAPVSWLVQSNCAISGVIELSGQNPTNSVGGNGGPGGYRGGDSGIAGGGGQGPGGGSVGLNGGCGASYGSQGFCGSTPNGISAYGNQFLIPLLGGSGGGGATNSLGGGSGGGGGGAILIAASGQINISGTISANGGSGRAWNPSTYIISGGGGSGGAVRLVASKLVGTGTISVAPGGGFFGTGGYGRVRFDTLENNFGGSVNGAFTQGYQPIIIQTNGQGAQLTVTTVGGVPVSASPSGQLATPDAVLSAQQNNPVPIVVHCSNIPLNTQITVSVKPANGAVVSAMGLNSSGTLSSSTATVLINMPRGGGIIYATAAN